MQPILSEPKTLERDPIVTHSILQPLEFPKAKGKTTRYIVKVKDDAPFEFETICGETISKYTVTKDSKRAKNSGKPPQLVYKTFNWDKKQLETFQARVKEMDKVIYDKEKRDYSLIKIEPWIEIMTIDEYKKMLVGNIEEDEVIAP